MAGKPPARPLGQALGRWILVPRGWKSAANIPITVRTTIAGTPCCYSTDNWYREDIHDVSLLLFPLQLASLETRSEKRKKPCHETFFFASLEDLSRTGKCTIWPSGPAPMAEEIVPSLMAKNGASGGGKVFDKREEGEDRVRSKPSTAFTCNLDSREQGGKHRTLFKEIRWFQNLAK